LPLAQMALGVVLFWRNDLWMTAAMHVDDMPGPSPAFTLLLSMNPPVTLLHGYLYWHMSPLWERALTVASIGALWYWIALNVDSWRERKMILQFKRPPLRITADLLAIPLGAFLEAICVRDFSYHPLPWRVPIWISVLVWSFGPMFFFGRDLVYCIRRKSPKIGN
jgi:hypothetical protein